MCALLPVELCVLSMSSLSLMDGRRPTEYALCLLVPVVCLLPKGTPYTIQTSVGIHNTNKTYIHIKGTQCYLKSSPQI